jgi:carbon-monoxide dehydrogenase small subunit
VRLPRAGRGGSRLRDHFCTPGFIVAIHDLLDRVPEPGPLEVREALAGNLCRCTGYGRILAAIERVVAVRGNGQ